uniref:DUF4283 domain-containing protein n=1 Tax=Solanum tuberosum TaxID=4113 RepID=M1DPP6_SOLTU
MEKNGSIPDTSVGHNIQLGANCPVGTRILHGETNSMQQMNLNEQQAIDQTTKKQASENISEEAQSSNFSFGVTGQKQQTKGKEVAGKPIRKNSTQTDVSNTEAHLHKVVNEHISRTVEVPDQVGRQVQKEKEGQKDQNKDVNQPRGTNRLQQGNDRANLAYQNNFPKISNNYTRYDPNSQRNRNDSHHVNHNASQGNVKQPNNQQPGQAQNNAKHDIILEPAPFTIVQSFAARLRYNQSKNEIPIVLDSPVFTTRQGLPAVLLEEDDYNIKLVESCKHTLVGKFTNTMPKMEIIRKSFTLQTQLNGGVKIIHYNSRHVYIDLDNEFDYVMVWTKQRMSIEGNNLKGAGKSQIQQLSRVTNPEGSPSNNQQQRDNNFDTNDLQHQTINESSGQHTNNRSQGRPSKNKREAMKRKKQQEVERNDKIDQCKKAAGNQTHNQKSDYEVLNSEDGFDEDTQSLNEEEEDETSAHLIKAFGSTFQRESQAEIQKVADQQCLLPSRRR